MSDTKRPHVLIVGAGAMGILTGYHLELANAEVTFLVRPHRKPMLEKPQILYNYNDNELKEYKGLRCLTDPSEMVGQTYDYIVVTLDGNALRSEAGETLVKSLGEAARGKETKVILGAVAFNPLPWFLETSGLLDKQVTNGVLGIEVYPTNGVTLPVNPPTDPKLIAQADWAYVDCFGYGFAVTDHSHRWRKASRNSIRRAGFRAALFSQRRNMTPRSHRSSHSSRLATSCVGRRSKTSTRVPNSGKRRSRRSRKSGAWDSMEGPAKQRQTR